MSLLMWLYFSIKYILFILIFLYLVLYNTILFFLCISYMQILFGLFYEAPCKRSNKLEDRNHIILYFGMYSSFIPQQGEGENKVF